MFRCPQFTTGEYTEKRAFLPDKVYGLALDALVKAVSDVYIVSCCGGGDAGCNSLFIA